MFVNTTLATNGSQTLVISPSTVDPTECVASGDGLGAGLVVGQPHTFQIFLLDRFRNAIPYNGSEVLHVQLVERDDNAFVVYHAVPLKVNHAVLNNVLDSSRNTSSYFSDQAYQVTYTITNAAQYVTNITINGEPISNAEINVTLLPAAISPSNCIATGDLDSSAIAGIPRTFQVQLRDEYTNDITDVENTEGIVATTISSASSGDIAVDIEYSGQGLFTCTYTPIVTGEYKISITVNGEGIENPQHTMQVIPAAPDPARCLAEGAALTTSVAGTISSFSIYLFDAFNNSIPTNVSVPGVIITSPTSVQVWHQLFIITSLCPST